MAASVFSEHKKLEPMPAERKARWRKEIDWLLSVTDYIVEFAPIKQSKDGVTMEVIVLLMLDLFELYNSNSCILNFLLNR